MQTRQGVNKMKTHSDFYLNTSLNIFFFVNVFSVYCNVSISLTVVYSNLLLVLLIRSGFGCISLLFRRGGPQLANADPGAGCDLSLLPLGTCGKGKAEEPGIHIWGWATSTILF